MSKGDGPHMVLERKKSNFDCKYFVDNRCIQTQYGTCDFKMAMKGMCRFYNEYKKNQRITIRSERFIDTLKDENEYIKKHVFKLYDDASLKKEIPIKVKALKDKVILTEIYSKEKYVINKSIMYALYKERVVKMHGNKYLKFIKKSDATNKNEESNPIFYYSSIYRYSDIIDFIDIQIINGKKSITIMDKKYKKQILDDFGKKFTIKRLQASPINIKLKKIIEITLKLPKGVSLSKIEDLIDKKVNEDKFYSFKDEKFLSLTKQDSETKTVNVGDKLKHKTLGECVVLSVEKNYFFVRFEDGKEFQFSIDRLFDFFDKI